MKDIDDYKLNGKKEEEETQNTIVMM